jgi:hypothetical protein
LTSNVVEDALNGKVRKRERVLMWRVHEVVSRELGNQRMRLGRPATELSAYAMPLLW